MCSLTRSDGEGWLHIGIGYHVATMYSNVTEIGGERVKTELCVRDKYWIDWIDYTNIPGVV
jgi:hypothetical protein